MNSRHILGHIIIAIFSFLAAFFVVFNVLFSDVNAVSEEASSITFVVVVYMVMSLLAHWIWPVRGWIWVRWFVTPALLLGGFYLFQEFNSLNLYGVFVLAAVVAGAAFGREAMSRKRSQKVSSVEP